LTTTFVDNISSSLTKKLNTQIAHLTLARTDDPLQKIGPAERQSLVDALLEQIDSFSRELRSDLQSKWPYDTTPTTISMKPGLSAQAGRQLPFAATNEIIIVQSGSGSP
jgi:hypothetical protein